MTKVSDIKQEDIIRSAIEVFSQKGFHQASMEGISKHAGVSKRTLYKYFPNKDALFEVIVDKLMCKFDDNEKIRFDSNEPLEEQLTRITLRKMCYVTTNDFQLTARLVMSECIRCPQISEMLSQRFAAIEQGYRLNDWIEEGIKSGALEVNNIDLAVEQFFGSIKAIVFWPQLIAHQAPASQETFQLAIQTAVRNFLIAHKKAA